MDDAQYIKFQPGQNPYVDATRRTVAQQVATPIPPEVFARAAAAGVAPTWTGSGWGAPGGGPSGGGPNYGSRPDLYPSVQQYQDRYQRAIDYLNGLQTRPIGTPALNQLMANRQTAPSAPNTGAWRWG